MTGSSFPHEGMQHVIVTTSRTELTAALVIWKIDHLLYDCLHKWN
jgi:hypothetical protein